MADRLVQIGWILLGLAVACVFTMVFALAGVVAAVIGVACLAFGSLARLSEGRGQSRAHPAVIDVTATSKDDEPSR